MCESRDLNREARKYAHEFLARKWSARYASESAVFVEAGKPSHSDNSSHAPAGKPVRKKARAAACTVGRKSLNALKLKGRIKAPSFAPRFGVRPEAGSSIENNQCAARVKACDVARGQSSFLIA